MVSDLVPAVTVPEPAIPNPDSDISFVPDSVAEETAEELHARNMAAFKKYQPEIYGIISNYNTQSTLVYTEDGEPDVEFLGERLYEGEGAYKYTEKQMEEFWKSPQKLIMPLLDSRHLDEHANIFSSLLMDKVEEEKIEFHSQPILQSAYFLTIMGIGLAPHIDALVEKSECRQLILIEPNPEFIFHSTFVYDWASLLKKFSGDQSVSIVISSRPEGIQSSIQSFMRTRNPSGLDGALFYTHYNNAAFSKAYQDLREGGLDIAMMGLGFFEDELNMVTQSYENLRHGNRHILADRTDQKSIPVFIVGNGPSVDSLMPVIKENKDKAVIIGCGSALDPLMDAGVVPDFLALLERDPQLFPELKTSAQEFDLSQVCLFGASNVYPGIPDLFGDSILFFRPGISPSPLFARNEKQKPPRPDPLVANAALAFAYNAGFREIYFFGVDVGAKDPNYHHSKKSWYTTRGHSYDEFTFDITTPGNFGGTVSSTNVLMWSKTALEASVMSYPGGRQYYNCSGGALIKGVIPKHPSTLSLPDVEEKSEIVRSIIESFPYYTKDDFEESWKKADIYNRLQDVRDNLVNSLDEGDLEDMGYAIKIMKHLKPGDVSDPVAMIYRGSVYFMLMFIHLYIRRVKTEEQRETFQALVREAFSVAMDKLKDIATEKFRAVEAGTVDWSEVPEPPESQA